MAIEFYFTPELHLKDGRIIRDLEDAASFAREQEVRPGVDQRDEILHKIERADSKEEFLCPMAGRVGRTRIARERSAIVSGFLCLVGSGVPVSRLVIGLLEFK